MRNMLFILCLANILFAQVNVVTSIPDLADITRNIGGEAVSVQSLARGTEDVHVVRARSSFIPAINRAHLVISLGLGAEDRWFVNIVNASRNNGVKRGAPGWVEAHEGMDILEKPDPDQLTHAGNHIHGNPHVNSGPQSGRIMARNIYDALCRVDPQNTDYYTANYKRYIALLVQMETELLEKGRELEGVAVITYHADMSYFFDYYGMELIGTIEIIPGVAPNSRHLAYITQRGIDENAQLVLFHQAQNPRLPENIAQRLGVPAVRFANMVKSREEVQTFIELQHYNLDIILKALRRAEGQ
ncbi:Zinc ABC transporter, periplasmic-binding protein ZnuA [Chitinispirillum alkaliphilum]|nr:Zinc ABC transporter, periplasmic-binding protein ZnuA [Chitinispirillum alkaliphilum]